MSVNQPMPPQSFNPQFQMLVSRMTRYLRFLGFLTIIGGVFYCLPIITAIVGIPIIIMGNRMRESADAFSRYCATNAFSDLYQAIDRQMRYLFIQYVFAIISLIGAALYLVVVVIALIVAISAGGFD